MIELLIKYIQDKGYRVKIIPPGDLMPGVLTIRKKAKGQLFGIDWAIPKHELHPDSEEILYYQATKRCDLIEEAITNYDPQP
jgi:hypothetical protein